jgi:hypothetical protein
MSPEMLDGISLEVLVDQASGQLVTRMKAYLWSNTIHKEVMASTRHPKTWWDSIKNVLLPRWLERRFPVRWEVAETVVNFIHVCPHMNIMAPSEAMAHIRFMSEPLSVPRFKEVP